MKNSPVLRKAVQDIRTSFIKFPHVRNILNAMDRLYDYRCLNEEPEHLALLGESGVGKSTLLIRYRDDHPAIEHDELTEVPVLYVAIGPSPTPKALASSILRALGDPKCDIGKEVDLTYRLVLLIKLCRVRLVIIDEANHLIDRGGEKTHHVAADWLKRLVDATRVSFVLAGIPRTRRLFEKNDQLRSRFREVIEIDRFSVENGSAELQFRGVLWAFKKEYLREVPTIDISSATMARKFAFATDGRLRDIRRLLVRAVELSYQESEPRLTEGILSDAFRTVIHPGAPNTRNPFHESFNELPLVKADEPFALVER
ncbi:TniB family NTP-binding protein [Paraburkholderia sp. J7]|uniref:TniB family NTP-binding protein n=1 Tax=Paraburkholderia sp. J7 TaxID=2805438 RepID=UPI002AB74873|nr:TniB family NTP-binding protein [Paraburkholderia sp. J7]